MVGGAEEMVDTLDYITVPATAAAAAAAALQTQPFKWKFRKIWSLGWAGLGWAGLGWAGADNRQQKCSRHKERVLGTFPDTVHTGYWIIQRVAVTKSVPQSTLTTPGTQQTRGVVLNTAHSEIGDLAVSHSEQGAALR